MSRTENRKMRRHLNPRIKQFVNDIVMTICYLFLAAECTVIVAVIK